MAKAKSNRWKWVFAAIFTLALGGAAVMITFNVRQQLTAEALEKARQRWETRGPSDYLMTYTVRHNDNPTTDHYVVTVRGKQVVEARVNDLPQPKERLEYLGMDAQFDYIERFLEIDSKPGNPRTFARGVFDEQTGALRWYVRRVMGKRERVEIIVMPLQTP
ncbi:MAG: DUF6174 domain-containing protein [Gemmataceae bacterium]|nr:DUF6174 domain-containing protein [Gemmataceae bacterium]